MKLTDNLYFRLQLKGTIVLFLFLHFVFFGFAQKYTLKITSNDSILPKSIKKEAYRKSFSDSALLFLQLEKIKTRLFSDGYIAASFDRVKFDSASVNASLFLGRKYRINELYIKGIYASLKRKFHLSDSGIQVKNTVNPAELSLLYEHIINEYENSGYPFAMLISEKVEFNDSSIRLNLKLEKNKLIRFHKIIIKGDAKISKAYINRYLSVFEGDIYNEEVVKSISSKITAVRFLSEIRPPEVDFFDDKADVYLYLKSKKANLFNGVVGIIPDKNNENKVALTGNLDLNLLNNFGKGENVFLKWSRTDKLSQKLDVGFVLPYLFKSPFSIQSKFNLDKRDTSFMKISGKFGIDYNFKHNEAISAFIHKKQSLVLSGESSDTSIYKNSDLLLFGLFYRSLKFDYVYNPTKGYVFDAGFAGGNRKIIGKSKPYYEANFFAEYYVPFNRHFVLKFSSDTKYAFPEEKFYENELFDLGGFNSLRGFDENRFRTSAYSVFTVEQRYLYEQNSNVFAFFNIAGFRDNTNVKNNLFPYGFGIGTNLSTKAGIFSITYALGNLPGNILQFSNSKIHIGYVNRF